MNHAAVNPRSLVQTRFALNQLAALKLATQRQWTLFLRDKAFLIVRLMQVSADAVLKPGPLLL